MRNYEKVVSYCIDRKADWNGMKHLVHLMLSKNTYLFFSYMSRFLANCPSVLQFLHLFALKGQRAPIVDRHKGVIIGPIVNSLPGDTQELRDLSDCHTELAWKVPRQCIVDHLA